MFFDNVLIHYYCIIFRKLYSNITIPSSFSRKNSGNTCCLRRWVSPKAKFWDTLSIKSKDSDVRFKCSPKVRCFPANGPKPRRTALRLAQGALPILTGKFSPQKYLTIFLGNYKTYLALIHVVRCYQIYSTNSLDLGKNQ